MATIHEDESPKTITRRTLRAVNSVAGLCGLVLNTVTLTLAETSMFQGNSVIDLTCSAYVPIIFSIAWNHLESRAQRALPPDHKWAAALVDVGLFLGFLAILIASGIIQHDLWWLDTPKDMIMTYNNMPWMVCAAMHLFFIFEACKDMVGFSFGWECSAICKNCQRKFPTTLSRKKDGAKYGLLNDQDEDEDVEDTSA